ncbi:hypothetical protein SSCG_00419 [Streptomyces clavuligerus]|nr:hypothetical protein SSCG_00419 [Streptomyces clavuligerus]
MCPTVRSGCDEPLDTATGLGRIINQLRRAVLRTREAEDLPDLAEAQTELLRVLSEGGSLTSGELAVRLSVAPSTVSDLVRTTTASGIVERTPSSTDLCTVRLVASPPAIDLLNRYDRAGRKPSIALWTVFRRRADRPSNGRFPRSPNCSAYSRAGRRSALGGPLPRAPPVLSDSWWTDPSTALSVHLITLPPRLNCDEAELVSQAPLKDTTGAQRHRGTRSTSDHHVTQKDHDHASQRPRQDRRGCRPLPRRARRRPRGPVRVGREPLLHHRRDRRRLRARQRHDLGLTARAAPEIHLPSAHVRKKQPVLTFIDSNPRSPRRLAAAVLLVAGLVGSLGACASSDPTVPDARTAATAVTPPSDADSADHAAAAHASQAPEPLDTGPTGRAPEPLPTPSAAPGTPHQSGTPQKPSRPASATHRPATPPPAGQQQRLPEGRLTVAKTARLTVDITGLPASPRLVPGGAPLKFTVTMRNTGATDHPLIAPVVRFDQYDGGLAPLGSVAGRLERFDPATGSWQPVFLPQASGMDFLLAATGGAPLPKGATTTIRYRVSVDTGLRAGATELQVYAVSQPTNQQAGMATAKVTIAP